MCQCRPAVNLCAAEETKAQTSSLENTKYLNSMKQRLIFHCPINAPLAPIKPNSHSTAARHTEVVVMHGKCQSTQTIGHLHSLCQLPARFCDVFFTHCIAHYNLSYTAKVSLPSFIFAPKQKLTGWNSTSITQTSVNTNQSSHCIKEASSLYCSYILHHILES